MCASRLEGFDDDANPRAALVRRGPGNESDRPLHRCATNAEVANLKIWLVGLWLGVGLYVVGR